MEQSIIKVQNLNVWYNGFHALKGINLAIQHNCITSFIGASGSGKSSLLRSMNRMLDNIPNARTEGKIFFNGKDILEKGTDVISLRRKVGMVFQNPTPFPKSIFDNVAYGLEIQGIVHRRRKGLLEIFSKEISCQNIENSHYQIDTAVVKSLKEAVLWEEVKDRLHQSAFRLSGGQQQRLCIARAIAVRPQVLLLDEPCSELDPISTKKIEDLLMQLKKDYTIVIVTHNMHQAKRISDYTGFFHLGELVEFDSAKNIFENPRNIITSDYIKGNFG